MATKLQIINKAIVGNGGQRIESLTEDDENARKFSVIYDIVLEDMLASHEWNFAKEEYTLSRSSESPVLSDFTYKFPLPSDFLKLVKTSIGPTYSHKIKGNYLYATPSSVSIEYVKLITDPEVFSPKFTEALVKRLEAETCFDITGNAQMTQLKYQLADIKLREAKSINAHDITPDDAREDQFINSRF